VSRGEVYGFVWKAKFLVPLAPRFQLST
jgi:hypothetical protein